MAALVLLSACSGGVDAWAGERVLDLTFAGEIADVCGHKVERSGDVVLVGDDTVALNEQGDHGCLSVPSKHIDFPAESFTVRARLRFAKFRHVKSGRRWYSGCIACTKYGGNLRQSGFVFFLWGSEGNQLALTLSDGVNQETYCGRRFLRTERWYDVAACVDRERGKVLFFVDALLDNELPIGEMGPTPSHRSLFIGNVDSKAILPGFTLRAAMSRLVIERGAMESPLAGREGDPRWVAFYEHDGLNVAKVAHHAAAVASAKMRRRYEHGPECLSDGKPGTYWNAGDPGPHWVQINWQFPRYVREVALAERIPGTIEALRILGRIEGTISDRWAVLAANRVSGEEPVLRASFPRTPVKCLRVELTPRSDDLVLELSEVKAYTDERHLPNDLAGEPSAPKEQVRLTRLRLPAPVPRGSWIDVAALLVCRKKLVRDYGFFLKAGWDSLMPDEDYRLVEAFTKPEVETSRWPVGETQRLRFRVWIPEYSPPGQELELRIYGCDGASLLGVESQGELPKLRIAGAALADDGPRTPPQLVRMGQQTRICIDGEILSGRHVCMRTKTFENFYNMAESGYRIFEVGSYPQYMIDTAASEDWNLDRCLRIIDRQCKLVLACAPDPWLLVSFIYRGTREFIKSHQAECVRLPNDRVIRPSPASAVFRKACYRVTARLLDRLAERPYAGRIIGFELHGFEDGTFHWWGYNRGVWGKRDEVVIPVDVSAPGLKAYRGWLQRKYGRTPFDTALIDTGAMSRYYGGAVRDPKACKPAVDYFDFRHDLVLELRTSLAELIKKQWPGNALVQTHSTFPSFGIFSVCPPLVGNGQQHRLCSHPAIDSLGQNHSYNFRRRDEHYLLQIAQSSLQLHGKIAWSELDNRTYLSRLADYKEYSLKGSIELERLHLGAGLCTGVVERRLAFDSIRTGGSPVLWTGCPELTKELRRCALIKRFANGEPWHSDKEIAVFICTRSAYYMDLLTPGPTFNQLYHVLGNELNFIGAPHDVYFIDDLAHLRVAAQYKLCVFLTAEALSDEQVWLIDERLKANGRTLLWFWVPGYVDEKRGLSAERVNSIVGMDLAIDRADVAVEIVVDRSSPLCRGFGEPSFRVRRAYANRQWFRSKYNPHFHVTDPGAEAAGRYAHNGKVGLAVQRHANWTSVFCGASYLPRQVIRNVAKQAGVHLYTDRDGVYLTASRNWLVLHNVSADDITVPVRLRGLGKIIDVFSRNVIADGADRFDSAMGPYETRLFYLGGRDVERVIEGGDDG